MQCWRLLRVRELHGVISAEHAAFSEPRGRGARAQRRGNLPLRAPAEGRGSGMCLSAGARVGEHRDGMWLLQPRSN